MKLSYITYSLLLVSLFFVQCKTSKTKLESAPPFTVEQATVNDWFGGREGVKGTKVEIHFTNLTTTIHQIYFEKRIEKLHKRSSNKADFYIANFSKGTSINYQLNDDSKKEYGNTIPNSVVDFPFKLEKNECIISYLINNKEHFYKIILKRKEAVYMP